MGAVKSSGDMRQVSLFSLAASQMLGNRIGCAIFAGVQPPMDNAEEVTEFLWLHAAPSGEVVHLVAGGDRAALRNRMLEWAAGVTPERFVALREAVLGVADDAAAAEARVILDGKEGDSKN